MNENTIKYQIDNAPDGTVWTVVNHSDLLISGEVVRKYLKFNYGNFICEDLHEKFNLYNLMQAADLDRALHAWEATYNPLENYNGVIERLVTDDHGDEVRTHKTGGEGGTHNKVTSAALSNTGTEHQVSTDESPSYRNETKDIQTGGTETTDDLHTEDKTTHNTTSRTVGEDTVTADTIHTEREEKHGNLGVTTSQQMIESECEMRLNPVTKQYLDRFVFQYAHYSGGAWGGLFYDC